MGVYIADGPITLHPEWIYAEECCETCQWPVRVIEGISRDIHGPRGLEGVDVQTYQCTNPEHGEIFSE